MKKPGAAQWGLYDTAENIWLYDDHGPTLFSDKMAARIAARVLDEQLDHEPGRTHEKLYVPGPLTKKAMAQVKRSALDALKGL